MTLPPLLRWAGWLLLAFGALYVLLLAHGLLRLRRLLWRRIRIRLADRALMPHDVRAVLEAVGPMLRDWGFTRRYTLMQRPLLVLGEDADIWCDVYVHADGRTHLLVNRAEALEALWPYEMQWVSALDDGRFLHTVNAQAHLRPPASRGWLLEDACAADPAAAWALHRQRVQAAGAGVSSDGPAILRALQESAAGWVPELVQRRWLVPAGPRRWRMSWRACAQMLWQAQRAASHMKRLRVAVRAAAPATAAGGINGARMTAPAHVDAAALAAAAVQTDVEAWRQHQAVQQATRAGRRDKWLGFGLSAVLFLVLGAWLFSWDFVLMLAAVIALHEGGHLLAMRLTGHRHLSVWFLPGVGGMAMGEKHDASAWQRLAVYLAGPMPGLLLVMAAAFGLGRGVFDLPAWAITLLLLGFVINYLNLLPITPLDGGRVLDLLLFARWPRLRFVFSLACCVLLAAAGWALDDMVLKVLAGLMALSLPHAWRVIQVSRATPAAPPQGQTEEQAATDLLRTMREGERFQDWPFARRAAMVQALLPERMGRRPSWRESLLGLTLYAACLLAPLAAAWTALPHLPPTLLGWVWSAWRVPADEVLEDDAGDPGSASVADADADAEADIDWAARASDPALGASERLHAQMQALQTGAIGADESSPDAARVADGVGQSLRAIEQAAAALPPGDLNRARAWLLLAEWDDGDERAVESYLDRVLADLPTAEGAPQRLLLAQAKAAKAELGHAPLPARVQWMGEALALREGEGATSHPELLRWRQHWALLLDEQGDSAAARAALRQNLAALPAPAGPVRSRSALRQATARIGALNTLAWFELDHGDMAAARALAQQAVDALPASITRSWLQPAADAHEVRLWAALAPPPTAPVAGALAVPSAPGAGPVATADDLQALWRAYERAATLGQPPGLKLLATQAVLAQATGDARALQQARDAAQRWLEPMPPASRALQCRTAGGLGEGDWARRAHRARMAALATVPACAFL